MQDYNEPLLLFTEFSQLEFQQAKSFLKTCGWDVQRAINLLESSDTSHVLEILRPKRCEKPFECFIRSAKTVINDTFAPPHRLMDSDVLRFSTVLQRAAHKKVWVLVNIQNSGFDSFKQNRKLWNEVTPSFRKEMVDKFTKSVYMFDDGDTSFEEKHLIFEKLGIEGNGKLPLICLINPFTGKVVKQASNLLKPERFNDKFMKLLLEEEPQCPEDAADESPFFEVDFQCLSLKGKTSTDDEDDEEKVLNSSLSENEEEEDDEKEEDSVSEVSTNKNSCCDVNPLENSAVSTLEV